jgi:methyl-accepting chemotaxis protein
MSTKGKLYFVTGSLLLGLGIVSTISYTAAKDLASIGSQMYDDAALGLQNSANAGMAVQRGRFLAKVITDETMKAHLDKSLEELENGIKQEKEAFDAYEKTIVADDDRQNFNSASQLREKYDVVLQKTMQMAREGKFKEANGYVNANKEMSFEYAKSITKVIDWNVEHAKELKVQADDAAQSAIIKIITASTLVLLFGLIAVFFIVRQIENSLRKTQIGLNAFFAFLNRETDKTALIDINSEDEFGLIAREINANILGIEKNLQQDIAAVEQSKRIIARVQHGWYSEFIEATPASPELNSFKNTINDMIKANQSRFDEIATLLEMYSKNDYTSTVDMHSGDEAGGILERLIKGLHAMQNTINTMLTNSLQNGLDLQSEAGHLKQAVESLSTASNEQAASLEETAAAMEEMTSNVQNNVQKSNEMAIMAAQTDASAKEGADLAHRTADAMTEIQSATNSINDAVAIIENIAFQTNILSLNAAVEAATAGDAGKGFAVVAQEVRNLANRSADAAKEIKTLAALAARKSNDGMNIANELTRGFEGIADKIQQTSMMVQDVSNASREQMQGIGQINTAVTQLDQMTQENAKIAAEADGIANATIDKAQAMVEDASSKNFVGKNQIQQSIQKSHTPPKIHQRPAHKSSTFTSSKKSTPAKSIKHTDDDIWESF